MQDLIVIGGGINGVGIANDAAGRGLSVTLLEKNDLAGATSSNSQSLFTAVCAIWSTMNFDWSTKR